MKFSNWFGKKSTKSSESETSIPASAEKVTKTTPDKSTLKVQVFDALKSISTANFPEGLFGRMSVVITDKGASGSDVLITTPFYPGAVESELSEALLKVLPDNISIHFNYSPVHPPSSLPQKAKIVIAVASGKGGVGKSTVTANLAAAAAQLGHKVGVLDADIYGPSIPMMFGLQGENVSSFDEKTMEPLFKYDVALNSIGFLVPADKATIWRGPMASRALMQLVNETNWPELDILFVDMPPGTGDIQLTMSEQIKCHAAIIVTTPQNIALADAQKGIEMFQKVNTPILGVVENMSQFTCPDCGASHTLFGAGGGSLCAEKHKIPLLAQLSLKPEIRNQGDIGKPFSLLDTNNEYQKLVFSLMMHMSNQTEQRILTL
mgnify:CR=1 FL=1